MARGTLTGFYIDILDATGAKVGDGPIRTAVSINDVQSLDRIGSIDMIIPNTEPRLSLITSGSQFDVYDEIEGYLGRFLFQSEELRDTQGIGTVIIKAKSVLHELTRETVGFLRAYNFVAVDTVIANLLTAATIGSWSSTVDTGIGNTTVTYQGESIFRAIDEMRDRWGQHFRLKTGSARHLEFGAFGDASGVTLVNAGAQVQAIWNAQEEVAIVANIAKITESQEIFNRYIPLGAGQGYITQLTIENATLGVSTVKSALNQDGVTSYFYIEDTASIAANGLRTRILSLSNVRPISNSDANILNAKNALKLIAENQLVKHANPRITYNVELAGLNTRLQVGQLIHLDYKGVADGNEYLNVDEDFYIMDIRTGRNINGQRQVGLTISSISSRRTQDTDVLISVVNDIKSLKVHLPLTLAYAAVGPYTKRIKSGINAEFTVRIQDEVTQLNRALLRFKTFPLTSSVTGAAAGGDHRHKMFDWNVAQSTPPTGYYQEFFCKDDAAGTNNNNVWLAIADATKTDDLWTFDTSGTHTHTPTYDVFSDTTYPQVISVTIDGVDQTVALGGTWAPANSQVEIEVDITDILVNAAGGLRQNHSVVFSCTTGKGKIEFEVDMLVTIQAVLVT